MLLTGWKFIANEIIFDEKTCHNQKIIDEANDRNMPDNSISYSIIACNTMDIKNDNIYFQIGIYKLSIPKEKILTFIPFIRMISENSSNTTFVYMYLLDGNEFELMKNAEIVTTS